MIVLQYQKVKPLKRDDQPLNEDQIAHLFKFLQGWEAVKEDGVPHLKRSFKFKNFAEALAFTNAVGEIAEAEGHHPLIFLTWGLVTVEWWTHDLQGLHMNDFIMADKTNGIFNKTFS